MGVFEALAQQLMQGADPNTARSLGLQSEGMQLQAQHNRQRMMMQQQQMMQQQAQVAQQNAMQQREEARQRRMDEIGVVDNYISHLHKAETPAGARAVAAAYNGLLPPEKILAGVDAANDFIKKQQEERADNRNIAAYGQGLTSTAPPSQSIPAPPQSQAIGGMMQAAPFFPGGAMAGAMMQAPQVIPPQSVLRMGDGQQYYPMPKRQGIMPAGNNGMMFDPNTHQYIQPPAQSNAGTGLTGEAKNVLWSKNVLAHQEQFTPQEVDVAKQIEDSNNLSPEAVEFNANLFLKTGRMPEGMGMGGAKIKAQILNKAAKVADVLGLDAEDVIAAGAEVGANRKALDNLTKQKTMVDAFSDFTENQLGSLQDTLSALQKKIPMFNQTFLNVPVQKWSKDVQGLPETQAFQQQLVSTRTEVARLVAGLAGSGATLPVQFEKEWESVISPNASPARIMAFIKQANIDKTNRTKAFEQAQQTLISKFKKGSDPTRVDSFLKSDAAPSSPEVGTVEEGHKFLGGDPSNPKSWEAVQ